MSHQYNTRSKGIDTDPCNFLSAKERRWICLLTDESMVSGRKVNRYELAEQAQTAVKLMNRNDKGGNALSWKSEEVRARVQAIYERRQTLYDREIMGESTDNAENNKVHENSDH